MSGPPPARIEYYGISPWEIEVAYGYLSGKFRVEQQELEQTGGEDFVSYLSLYMPVQFGEQFFKWFELRRWDRLKGLFKEMKRRRGSGNAIKIEALFGGAPSVMFSVDARDKAGFDRAVEKIDFVAELLPYHLAEGSLPPGAERVSYSFDAESARWAVGSASAGGAKFVRAGDRWARAP